MRRQVRSRVCVAWPESGPCTVVSVSSVEKKKEKENAKDKDSKNDKDAKIDSYVAVDSFSETAQMNTVVEEHVTTAETSQDSAFQKEMAMYSSYIDGMLRNFKELPADRIHNMLTLFADCDKSPEQIKQFLDYRTAQGELENSGIMYTLAKNTND